MFPYNFSLVTEFVNNDVAVVELLVEIPDVYFGVVSGVARRDPVDKPDDELALKLAWGRAFEQLSRRILRQANGLVKHNDDLREQKEQRSSLASFYSEAIQSALRWLNTGTTVNQNINVTGPTTQQKLF